MRYAYYENFLSFSLRIIQANLLILKWNHEQKQNFFHAFHSDFSVSLAHIFFSLCRPCHIELFKSFHFSTFRFASRDLHTMKLASFGVRIKRELFFLHFRTSIYCSMPQEFYVCQIRNEWESFSFDNGWMALMKK